MDPTEPQDGPNPLGAPSPRDGDGTADLYARARLDRRAEALRANLKRRKAQVRGRAERGATPD